jgi:hypothetical protein
MQRRRAIIPAQAALALWVDSCKRPHPLVAKGGRWRRCANALEEEFPPQWLVSVDRLVASGSI